VGRLFFPKNPDRRELKRRHVGESDRKPNLKGGVDLGNVPQPLRRPGWYIGRIANGPGDEIARARLVSGAYSSGLSSMMAWIFSITASTTACLWMIGTSPS